MTDTTPRVRSVRIVADRTVLLSFADGTVRLVDLTPFLWGPIFSEIAADDAAFAGVSVDEQFGTICWPNGADLAPEMLHAAGTPVPGTTSAA